MLLVDTPYDQCRHTAAKTVVVDQHMSYTSNAGAVWHIIEITLRIRDLLVNSGGSQLMLDREACSCGL